MCFLVWFDMVFDRYGVIFLATTFFRHVGPWLWFPPKVALYFTAYCDVLCIFLGFAFNHEIYQQRCKLCHGIFKRCIARFAYKQIRTRIQNQISQTDVTSDGRVDY